MAKQIYSEFRITHKTKDEKEDFDIKLQNSLKLHGYKTKAEWIKDKYRELLKS